jgi:hypothetical protein
MNAEVVVGSAAAVIALVAVAAALRPRPARRVRRAREPGSRLVFGPLPRAPLAAVPRGALLARIDETFRTGRFCVLLGGHGTGKTHLAAAYARADRATVVWMAAEDAANAVLAYAELAGLAGPAEAAASRGLAWLDGLDRPLVVFDNAIDADALIRWLPARARVLVTTTVADFEILGGTVPVGGFDEAEAVRFLGARSGRDGEEAAAGVARELGCLPLALAQAGGAIRRQDFATYLDRLPHGAPDRLPGEGYPARVEDTTLAALQAVAARDGRALMLAELLALLAAKGVRRELAHRAGPDPVAVDAALGGLAAASLAEFDVGGEVVTMHRLTQWAVLSRLHADQRLAPALDRAFDVVEADTTVDAVDHTAALWRHFRALPSAQLAPRLDRILRLRRRSVDLLVTAGAATQARALGREVLADHDAYLPAGHDDTGLAARSLDRAGSAH